LKQEGLFFARRDTPGSMPCDSKLWIGHLLFGDDINGTKIGYEEFR
jgi:hypothetical protein